jgi:hypothetical protein
MVVVGAIWPMLGYGMGPAKRFMGRSVTIERTKTTVLLRIFLLGE